MNLSTITTRHNKFLLHSYGGIEQPFFVVVRDVALCLVAFTLPLSIKANTYAVLVFGMSWLLDQDWKSKLKMVVLNYRSWLPFVVFFLILLAGLANTEVYDFAFGQIERNVAFLLVPILLVSIRVTPMAAILLSFVLGIFTSLCFDIAIALAQFVEDGSTSHFFYYDLTSPFNLNPIYVSIFVLFAIAICTHFLMTRTFAKLKVAWIGFIIFFVSSLMLLASKMAVITMVLLILWLLASSVRFKKRILVWIVPIMIVVALSLSQIDFLKSRWQEIFSFQSLSIVKENTMTDFSQVNGITVRILFWKYTITEMINNPVLFLTGVGTGDTMLFLNYVYEKHNMAVTFSDEEKYGFYGYNVHNQFLQSLLKNGIGGIASLLFILVVMFRKSWKASYYLLNSACFILVMFFLTESVFEVNKGIMFAAFFLPLLYVNESILNHRYLEDRDSRNKGNSE